MRVVLENPATPLLWAYLEMRLKQELQGGLISFHRISFCGYGASWRKATELLWWRPGHEHFTWELCAEKGICSFGKKPHEQLTSSSCFSKAISKSRWCTQLAQVYPRKFAECLLHFLC